MSGATRQTTPGSLIRLKKGYGKCTVTYTEPALNPITQPCLFSVGRADDVIVLASGEKVVPAPMENVIMSSPLVNGVVMFGRQRNQVGVLIEPRAFADSNDVTSLRNKIW